MPSLGPSLEIETGIAAEGGPILRIAAWSMVVAGALMSLIGSGLFAHEVGLRLREGVTEGAVTIAVEVAGRGGVSALALALVLVGVIPLVTGATMLRGHRRPTQRLTIYDDWVRSGGARAPLWLGVGLAMMLGGGALFGHELRQREPDSVATSAEGDDMQVFAYAAQDEGTGGLGFLLALLGLVPAVLGAVRTLDARTLEAPVEPETSKNEPNRAPTAHRLFEWSEDEGVYYVDVPPETTGKIAFGDNRATIAQLRRRFGSADQLRIRLEPRTRGKLVIGETTVIFRMARPAPAGARPQHSTDHVDPFTYLRPSGLDAASLAAAFGAAMALAVWAVYFADRTPPPPDARYIEEMGIPAEFYAEPEDELSAVEDLEEREAEGDDATPVRAKRSQPEPRTPVERLTDGSGRAVNVGIARVISHYGPAEGSLLAVIEDGETDLDELFIAGVAKTDESQGGEIGEFVAGGEGIEDQGEIIANEGLRTGRGPAKIREKIDKDERPVELESQTEDVIGDVDTKMVKATIRRRMAGLEACYVKALRGNPRLAGKLTYTITINPEGRVGGVVIEADTIRDASVRACTIGKIKAWRFVTEDATSSSEVTFHVAFTG